MNELLPALILTLGIQVVFFAFAAWFKTDKVTDLSYGLTFVIVALYLVFSNPLSLVSVMLTAMVTLWGIRLAAYLFVRILKIGKDKRFDGIRERFWSFAKFWTLQGVAIWIIMVPVILGIDGSATTIFWIGVFIWLIGLLIETVADWQKYIFKNNSKNKGKWIETGLWKYARHPNYFGELLVWWGIFLAAIPGLAGVEFLAIVGPIGISALLLFVTGIPPLQKQMQKKYGGILAFNSYVERTRLLVPLPKLKK